MKKLLISCIFLVSFFTPITYAQSPIPIAVFDLEFISYSQEVDYGVKNEAEKARAIMVSEYLRDLLRRDGRYEVRDLSSIRDDIAKTVGTFKCNGCEEDLAKRIGASRSISGAVQKISVLIQTIVIREREVETGKVLRLYQTDIRGNTDAAWKRGVSWLVRNRLLADDP